MVTNFLTSYVEWLVSLKKGSANDQIALKKVFFARHFYAFARFTT